MLLIRCKSRVKFIRQKNDPQRVTEIKPFINKYNWKGINFQPEKDDQKKFEKNNVKVALNLLYAKN